MARSSTKKELGASGLDGVIAKLADSPYLSGNRSAMVKVKRIRTADCVVGGFRWAQAGGKNEGKIGSLLLGLYNGAPALAAGEEAPAVHLRAGAIRLPYRFAFLSSAFC